MARFSLGDLMNSQSKTAEQRKPGFEIKHIPIEQLVPSEANRYGIREVEELAASIEMVGLLHNLVVRKKPDGELFEIVSGERRYRACRLLHEEGKIGFATLPCKVESASDDAYSELELIMANSTARELNDYEKTYQAGRIRELLQAMKADGYKFKGRMREIVADILGVSPAQVGRMESIEKNLVPEVAEEFRRGEVGVTAAYELSRLPPMQQGEALEEYRKAGDAGAITKPKREPKPKPEQPKDPAKAVMRALATINVAVFSTSGEPRGAADIGADVLKAAGIVPEEAEGGA